MTSVIIPTLNAARHLPLLLHSLRSQTLPPAEIIIIDSASTDGTPELAARMGCTVLPIARAEFNHGATRNRAAQQAKGQILAFMTQDALPVDKDCLKNLLAPVLAQTAVAAYARQIARPGAWFGERFAREFNYPTQGHIRSSTDVERMGIGAYFFSNVTSALRADIFHQMGMFANNVIMNEDMLFCAALLDAGHSVAYSAEARVFHSHHYSLTQTFQRYFDVGVFFSRHFARPGLRTQGRGQQYVRLLCHSLIQRQNWSGLLRALSETGAKAAGYALGRRERFLPLAWKRACSMHKGFWNSRQE